METYQLAPYQDMHIHVLDADLRVCESLCILLRLEGFAASFSGTPGELNAFLKHRTPNVFFLNVDFDGKEGTTLYGRFRRMGAKYFALLDVESVKETVSAMKRGAEDVFTKPLDSHRILVALANAVQPKVPSIAYEACIKTFNELTPREREVLQRVVNGRSSKEVGAELGISHRTVEAHRMRLMQKLGVRNTAELIRLALD